MPFYGTAGAIVNFVNISTPNFTTFAWDFGDGNTSASENPQNTYASEGTYVVTLTASTADDSIELVFSDTVYIAAVNTGYTAPEQAYVNCAGVDPQIMLRISNDAGRTWGPEHWRPVGKRGEFHRRVRWNRLGAARRRVFEVVMTDPIQWRITGAYLEASRDGQGA